MSVLVVAIVVVVVVVVIIIIVQYFYCGCERWCAVNADAMEWIAGGRQSSARGARAEGFCGGCYSYARTYSVKRALFVCKTGRKSPFCANPSWHRQLMAFYIFFIQLTAARAYFSVLVQSTSVRFDACLRRKIKSARPALACRLDTSPPLTAVKVNSSSSGGRCVVSPVPPRLEDFGGGGLGAGGGVRDSRVASFFGASLLRGFAFFDVLFLTKKTNIRFCVSCVRR